jgi:hypothetical protein
MATLRQVGTELAKLLGRSRVDGVLHARALVDAKLAEPGRPGSIGGLKSPLTTPKQAALLALAMSSGVLPKKAIEEARQFYELPLVGGYRAFQCDSGIRSVEIDKLEAVLGAPFGDVLSGIIESYCLGLDPSGARPGLRFVGCAYGAASNFVFGSLDWRASSPDADGFRVSDHFTFLLPAMVSPTAAISRQIAIPAEVFAKLGLLLRVGSGGGDLGDVSARTADENESDDLEIAAAPGAIAAASCALH